MKMLNGLWYFFFLCRMISENVDIALEKYESRESTGGAAATRRIYEDEVDENR